MPLTQNFIRQLHKTLMREDYTVYRELPGGQRVEFRTPNYAKILRIMQSQLSVTIDSLREQLGINKSAVQRLLSSLKEKGYIEARNNKGGWRVLITPSL